MSWIYDAKTVTRPYRETTLWKSTKMYCVKKAAVKLVSGRFATTARCWPTFDCAWDAPEPPNKYGCEMLLEVDAFNGLLFIFFIRLQKS